MKCNICGSENYKLIHNGVRDNSKIDVYQCTKCGLKFLSDFSLNTNARYEQGEMRSGVHDEKADGIAAISWERWKEVTKKDDERRSKLFAKYCVGKNVLEFGCGNGGFLERIKDVACSITGVELDKIAVERLNGGGIRTVKSIHELSGEFDVICMFHVIEHLSNPDEYLKDLYSLLKPGGVLICETPNSEDALLTYYNCEAFANSTYWSKHVYLYSSKTLEFLFNRVGFRVIENTQIQRYSLSNHLYWLKEGKPGGHTIWIDFNDKELNFAYQKILLKMKKCDTLLAYFSK